MADKKKSANAARDGMRRRSMAQDGGDARRASTIRRSSLIRLMAVEQDLDKVEATLPSINNTASGLADAQISAAEHKVLSKKKRRMTHLSISVGVTWPTDDVTHDKESLRKLFSQFGRVKHVRLGEAGGRAIIVFRTQGAVGKALIHDFRTERVEKRKAVPNNKLLVRWRHAGEFDEDSLWSMFEEYGRLRYITVDNTADKATRHKRAIVAFRELGEAEAALNDPSLGEAALTVEEYVLPETDADAEGAEQSRVEVVLAANRGHIVPVEELHALYDLFRSTGGGDWAFKYGWERWDGKQCVDEDPSTWYGVTVEGGRVARLELGGNNLSGTLPDSIGRLKGLKALWLHHNKLRGEVPASIGSLTALKSLYLQDNAFKRMPSDIARCTELELLGIDRNNWDVGGIPPELEHMQLKIDR